MCISVDREISRRKKGYTHAGCTLLPIIGKSFLISYSIGAQLPIVIPDECSQLVAGTLNFESTTIPFESIFGCFALPNADRFPTRKWGLANTALTQSPPANRSEDLKSVWVDHHMDVNRAYPLQADSSVLNGDNQLCCVCVQIQHQ